MQMICKYLGLISEIIMFGSVFLLSAAAVFFGCSLNLRPQYAHTKSAKIGNTYFSLFCLFVHTNTELLKNSVRESEYSGLKV